jgi:2-polyprenyl-3-methyl-5-hydroxy-6-metoxy-1,4-benzoquinol methylase
MKNWLITTEPRTIERYKDLTMHAHPGLHDELAHLFTTYVPSGSTVLDVGAGAGAFSLRLSDLGYRVTALDVDPSKWNATHIPFMVLDVNKGVAASISDTFDAVCCVEVIEHVENPWALLRDLWAVVRPGGIVLVSTPNVANFLSRLHLLLKGNFYSFGPGSLDMGHINPIHPYEMREIIKQLGWRQLCETRVGYLPVMDFGTGADLGRLPYKTVVNLARATAYLLSGGENKHGWCLAFVLERPQE